MNKISKEHAFKILNDNTIIKIINHYYPSFSTIVVSYILENKDRVMIDTNMDDDTINYTYKREVDY